MSTHSSNPSQDPGSRPSDPERKPWSDLRRQLEAEGVRPTKTLGQNFLYDPNLARAMVRDAGVVSGDRVLEVGPGCGFLTVPLAELGVELVAVEIDERLLRIARRAVGERSNVRFLGVDVLESKRTLAPEVRDALWQEGDWHLVANLPYAISGPLVALLAMGSHPPRSMTILIQSEMAERFAAKPGTPAYGALSVRVALRYRAILGRRVGAQLFWPRPRVESRVLRLERSGDDEAAEHGTFDLVLEGLFQRRRKTLRAGLAAVLGDRARSDDALSRSGLDPGARPETLSATDFVDLAAAVSAV